MCNVCVSNGRSGGFGDGGNGRGMSESQRRGKNENKKAKKWFMPTEQRWREGFFIIGLFLRVPDSLAERRRQGDRRVCVVSLQIPHTQTHTQTAKTGQTVDDSEKTLTRL